MENSMTSAPWRIRKSRSWNMTDSDPPLWKKNLLASRTLILRSGAREKILATAEGTGICLDARHHKDLENKLTLPRAAGQSARTSTIRQRGITDRVQARSNVRKYPRRGSHKVAFRAPCCGFIMDGDENPRGRRPPRCGHKRRSPERRGRDEVADPRRPVSGHSLHRIHAALPDCLRREGRADCLPRNPGGPP